MDKLTNWITSVEPEFAIAQPWFCISGIDQRNDVADATELCAIGPVFPFPKVGVLSYDLETATAYACSFFEAKGRVAVQLYMENLNKHLVLRYTALVDHSNKYVYIAPYNDMCMYTNTDTDSYWRPMDTEFLEEAGKLCVSAVMAVREVVSRPSTVVYKASANESNAKRIAKGKKPLYDWHTVTIELPKPKSEPKGGKGSEKRPHDRRGCWHTVKKTGKKHWVSACVINKFKEGFVFKDYVVAPTQPSKQVTQGETHDR